MSACSNHDALVSLGRHATLNAITARSSLVAKPQSHASVAELAQGEDARSDPTRTHTGEHLRGRLQGRTPSATEERQLANPHIGAVRLASSSHRIRRKAAAITSDIVRQELLSIAAEYDVLAESVELIARATKP